MMKFFGIESKAEKAEKAERERKQARAAGINPDALSTLSGHTEYVGRLTVLPDGRLASGSGDNTIKVWNLLTGRCEATLSGHRDSVTALTVLPDGRLASGSRDKSTIKVWNVLSGTCEATLSGHTAWVSALTVLPDGRLASASQDCTIKVWNPLTGRCEATLSGHRDSVTALTVLPDGSLASGSRDKTIKVWNVLSGTCEATLSGHTAWVSAPTVLPDGRLASGSHDGTIKVWNPLTGLCEATLSGGSHVYALTVLPDGRLASASSDGAIKVWNVMSGACEATLWGHTTDSVYALTVLPNGRLASASKDCTIKVWDVGCRPVLLPGKAKAKPAELLPSPPPVKRMEVPPAITTGETTEEDAFGKMALTEIPKVLYIPHDKVRLGRELGKGGFGTVYEATWAFQTVAVKCYEGTRLPERAAAELRHEANIMLRLQHDCLVRFFGLVQEDRHPAMLVMEYGEKGSLYGYLHSAEDIPWGLRLRIAHELARGLAYLHEQTIVHRDIKSLNVVLDRNYHAKWCDFGLAELKLHSTTTSKPDAVAVNLAGTLRWMAPELFSRKSSTPSMPSDIWALAMVFFELASREIPFKDARTDQQIKDWIPEGEEVPDECQAQSPGFASLMQRCWAERTTRPTAEALSEELGLLNGIAAPPRSAKKANHRPASVAKAADSGYAQFSRR